MRLAYCLEESVQEHRAETGAFEASCNIGLPQGGVVVLHPDGDLSIEQLVNAGLTQDQAQAIREMRLNAYASIYVLTNDPKALPSRTTSQRGFVRIPQLLIAQKSTQEAFAVGVAGTPEDRFILSIR